VDETVDTHNSSLLVIENETLDDTLVASDGGESGLVLSGETNSAVVALIDDDGLSETFPVAAQLRTFDLSLGCDLEVNTVGDVGRGAVVCPAKD